MNDFARSLFRMSFLLKMVSIESEHQKKLGVRHKSKYELGKMIQSVESGFRNIKHELKLSGDLFDKELNSSEEKINAMHNILTILSDCDEKSVLLIEDYLQNSLEKK